MSLRERNVSLLKRGRFFFNIKHVFNDFHVKQFFFEKNFNEKNLFKICCGHCLGAKQRVYEGFVENITVVRMDNMNIIKYFMFY